MALTLVFAVCCDLPWHWCSLLSPCNCPSGNFRERLVLFAIVSVLYLALLSERITVLLLLVCSTAFLSWQAFGCSLVHTGSIYLLLSLGEWWAVERWEVRGGSLLWVSTFHYHCLIRTSSWDADYRSPVYSFGCHCAGASSSTLGVFVFDSLLQETSFRTLIQLEVPTCCSAWELLRLCVWHSSPGDQQILDVYSTRSTFLLLCIGEWCWAGDWWLWEFITCICYM
jgi:hypothetical protein